MTEETINATQLSKNLRQSHFSFGNFPKKQYKSVMQKDYPPHPLTLNDQYGKDINLRAAHFQLGDFNNKNFYATTNNAKYPHRDGFRPEKLNEQKKEDLRTHHFSLGKSGSTNISYSRLAYPPQEIPKNLKDDQENQKNKMRRHHHDFGETKQKLLSTHYDSEYNKPLPPDYLKQGQIKEDIMKRVVELRSSHIIFGKENLGYKTTQGQSFSEKPIDSFERKDNTSSMKSNFSLGNVRPDYQTMNQQFYIEQPFSKNTLAAETMRELRETHFVLGSAPQNLSTVQSSSFLKPGMERQECKGNNSLQYQNHFSLGDPKQQINYNSTYSRNMKEFEIPKENLSKIKGYENKNNFVMGKHSLDYRSENLANFKPPNNADKAALEERQKNELKNSHINFNDIRKNNYATTFQSSYQPREAQAGLIDEVLKHNLRKTHYNLGQNDGAYSTEYYTKYTKKNMPHNLNMRELSNQLRSTHFKLG